ncbi:MAG: PAS domain-containing protein [Chitinivibrionales bacterium]|nr:PAS domain-containing protein [Chitinivibrionales bacterium]
MLVEFSLIDHNDQVVAWNKHDSRLFRRPKNVLGRDVRNCHPPESLAQVERIIREMKTGEREKARFWIDMKSDNQKSLQKILIEYYALRNEKGEYLGCLEVTQNITEIQGLQGEKRLMD